MPKENFSFGSEYPAYSLVDKEGPEHYVNGEIFYHPKPSVHEEIADAYKQRHDSFDVNDFALRRS